MGIGISGGVGSSTIAHNIAWLMSSLFKSEVVVADLDLPPRRRAPLGMQGVIRAPGLLGVRGVRVKQAALHLHLRRLMRSMKLERVADQVLQELTHLCRIGLQRRQLADELGSVSRTGVRVCEARIGQPIRPRPGWQRKERPPTGESRFS